MAHTRKLKVQPGKTEVKPSPCSELPKNIAYFLKDFQKGAFLFFKDITPCINWKRREKEKQHRILVEHLKKR